MEGTGKYCIRIILTGPESTGKTELASALADKYNTAYIPEYAREYIGSLNRPYEYDDLVHIAKHQKEQMKDFISRVHTIIFADTYLMITRVWFEWVYRKYPSWIDDELKKTRDALYLLCKPDIPWFPDGMRENGGKNREILFQTYENHLRYLGLHYRYVSGQGDMRMENACRQVEEFINEKGIRSKR